MLQGKQTGIFIDGQGNGLKIEITSDGLGVRWQRIVNNNLQPFMEHQLSTIKEVYDDRTGLYVAGFELYDVTGNPTGEIYKLNQFEISGNLSYGDYRNGTSIGWFL